MLEFLGARAVGRGVGVDRGYFRCSQDSLAERSKAVAQGAIPKGRGLKPHSCHFSGMCYYTLVAEAWEYLPQSRIAGSVETETQ